MVTGGGGTSVMVAAPLLPLSAALVAVNRTVCLVAMDAGAMYSPPPSIVPVSAFRFQVAAVVPVYSRPP